MSASKDNLTEYTAYYRCPDKINNFKIRIRYKELNKNNISSNRNEEWPTRIFSWQEKHFSRSERSFYGDIHNCVTELEKKYHEKIVEEEEEVDSTVFTYVEEDRYIPEEEMYGKSTYLQKVVENTNGNIQSNVDEFDYMTSLISCFEKTVVTCNLEKMYIMADLGEYIENIWLKNEQQLCVIKYDKKTKMLSVYPDFTTTQPYYKKIQGETTKHFYYFIENHSGNIPENISLTEKDLLKKLTHCKLSLRKQIIGGAPFHLPPKNKLYLYLFFEILSAKKFEFPDIYVQYNIDLPQHWSCQNPNSLKGATQLCHGTNRNSLIHFGHCFDVILEYDIQNLENDIPKAPYIYFEVISKTTWDRYRTEGLTYTNLPVSNPGCHLYALSCLRMTSGLSGELRRYFIGDCSNYKDLKWIGIPEQTKGTVMNKFGVNTVGTGELNVRVNILHQSQAFLDEFNDGDRREKLLYEKLSSSSLIKSVEQVLQAFRKAKRNLMEARKNV